MKERPILFSGPMVRALLNGSKTQTRRVVKPQPFIDELSNFVWNGWNFGQSVSGVPHIQSLASPVPWSKTKRVLCPYGAPGDRLWVRESLKFVDTPTTRHDHAVYAADGLRVLRDPRLINWACDGMAFGFARSVPSIHMPRWASRITLEITNVRVERLQAVSEDDAIAEGIDGPMCAAAVSRAPSRGELLPAAVHGFSHLWECLNASRGFGWHSNPWLWVVEFKRIEA